MARDVKNNPRPRPGGQSKASVWPGIMAGLVIGLLIAVGVFYLVSKNPPRFDNLLAQQDSQPKPVAQPPKPEELKPMGEEPAQQQRYDFYRILPGNGETTASGAGSVPEKPKAPVIESRPIDKPSFLQAGSFEQAEEADNLKAKLAMLGLDVEIQTTTLPNVGVRHRVKVGPLRDPAEIQRVRGLLAQNGIESVLSKE